jgi:hypothetical protein
LGNDPDRSASTLQESHTKTMKKHGIDMELLAAMAYPEITREQQNELADILADMAKELGMSQRQFSNEVVSAAGGPPLNMGN